MSKLIHFMFVQMGAATSAIPPAIMALINYFILGLGDDSFRFDGKLWLLFDVNKPGGFFAASLFHGLTIYTTVFSFAPIFCVFIGSCWSIVIFLEDISRDISHLRTKKIIKMTEQNLAERFCNFVQFYAEVEKLRIDIFGQVQFFPMKCELTYYFILD